MSQGLLDYEKGGNIMVTISDLLLTAITSALSSGAMLQKGFNSSYSIKNKEGKHNLVTEYDILSENNILKIIKEKYPDHNFICEESGTTKESQGIDWVIDPLDGTVNFAHGIPNFSVSIAAKQNDDILVGVVFNPITQELFYASKGQGAYGNGQKLCVTKTTSLDEAILATGFPYNLKDNPDNCTGMFLKIAQKGLPIRRLGSAAIDFAYVASGKFDGYWETNLGPWDCCAGILLVEEAGGIVTKWDGSPLLLESKNQVLVSNKHIHEQLLKEFQNQ
jgi:myo-inositol-1(or 4)-monophosphatase